ERLDQLGRVPREPCTKADTPGAGPVLEPADRPVELSTDLGRNERHVFQVVTRLLLPCRIAVLQEPLVVEDLDFDFVPAPAYDRTGVKLVHDDRMVFFAHLLRNFLTGDPDGLSAIL